MGKALFLHDNELVWFWLELTVCSGIAHQFWFSPSHGCQSFECWASRTLVRNFDKASRKQMEQMKGFNSLSKLVNRFALILDLHSFQERLLDACLFLFIFVSFLWSWMDRILDCALGSVSTISSFETELCSFFEKDDTWMTTCTSCLRSVSALNDKRSCTTRNLLHCLLRTKLRVVLIDFGVYLSLLGWMATKCVCRLSTLSLSIAEDLHLRFRRVELLRFA